MARTKKHASYTLTDTARDLLLAMAEADGKSRTGFLEDLIRATAKQRGVVLPPAPKPRARRPH